MRTNKVLFTDRIQWALLTLRNSSALLLKSADGQDLIEYALLAGFVAVAAGAIR